ncbi:MAG: 4Fe-4S dicluster domain-containing protein [Candidatus Cloacimonadota bacterium]|nr:4Fe-4S dicluster domain-containing protein [Candidatus Cloacimonadota bacterium]
MASSKIPLLVERFDFIKLIQNVQENFDVFLPYQTEYDGKDNLSYKKYSGDNDFVLNKYRTIDPLKTLFYLTSESVLPPSAESRKRIVLGVKNCDLLALRIYDKALLEDNFVEPNYKIWRENTYIISSDCDDALQSCHCNLMEYTPYPQKDDGLFDLNLSQIDDKYIVTLGSKKGEKLLDLLYEHCNVKDAPEDILEKLTVQRDKVNKKLSEINKDFSAKRDYSKISKNQDVKVWSELSKECVECGGCTNICPSCYCIIVNDESVGADFKRIRTWDSCQLTGYAEVAGGGSPRERVWERFRNRYQCKFDFMKKNFSQYGCTGCGRCIAVCPAEIDQREVIKKLQEV